jgi:hypothetical protein
MLASGWLEQENYRFWTAGFVVEHGAMILDPDSLGFLGLVTMQGSCRRPASSIRLSSLASSTTRNSDPE